VDGYKRCSLWTCLVYYCDRLAVLVLIAAVRMFDVVCSAVA
jgi:hypothetical protein